MIVYGVSYSSFSKLLKEVYVEVAEADFALPFKRQTDSRLALMTGMTRKDVSQIRRHLSPESSALPDIEHTLSTRVISRWLAGAPYEHEENGVYVLPYEGETAETPSFVGLVREMGGAEIPPRSVLDELIHVGAVQLHANGEVWLVSQSGVTAQDAEAKLAVLASDPAELFQTILHNIETPETPFLQRKVVYDHIGADGLAAIRRQTRAQTEEYLRAVNHTLAGFDRDRHTDAPAGGRHRVAIGVYYFEEPLEHEAPAAQQPTLPGRIRKPT